MGLFGLFASILGLGAMAKDSIGDYLQREYSYEKSLKNGTKWYHGSGGKIYSTKTRNMANMYFSQGRAYLKDMKTGEIQDLTAIDNEKREEVEKHNLPKDFIFYRKCDWDVNGHLCNIWVSDDIPGYFERIDKTYYITKRVPEFFKGELEDYDWLGRSTKRVKRFYDNREESYYQDGSPRTKENKTKIRNKMSRERAIEEGKKFYIFYFDPISTRCCYKDVNTDEPYYHNYKLDYFTKGTIVEKEVNIKPHHSEVEIVYDVIEVFGEQRYNIDGSCWIE